MNLTRTYISLSLFLIFLLSCKNRNVSCDANISSDSLLHLIVLSTNIDSSLKNKQIIEDGIANDTVLVKIYHRNEVEPGAFFDAADCFLVLDLQNLKVYRKLIEFDSNIEVKSDSELIECYKTKYNR